MKQFRNVLFFLIVNSNGSQNIRQLNYFFLPFFMINQVGFQCQIFGYLLDPTLGHQLFDNYMRGKKVVNNNQIYQNGNVKIDQNRPHLKKRVTQVKSLEPRFRVQIIAPQSQKLIKLPLQIAVNDYEFERRQRQTQEFHPNRGQNNGVFEVRGVQQISRFQRNTEGVITSKGRQNYLINSQPNHSNHSSQQKIKLVSADSKQKSLSRSENNSAKKRGIELTKTLLKKISGMYNDKDFQNRTYKCNREETTGMTMTLSGRGVCDQYQISDFDFQVPPNHTFNISNTNPLSFNDSGNWNRQSGYSSNSGNYSNNQQNTRLIQSDKKAQTSRAKHQSSQSKERIVLRTPEKEFMKVRRYHLLDTKKTSDSIVVGEQPPQRPIQSRRGAQFNLNNSQERERYLIRSKNKTMDQLSLKQSLVVGQQHYYQ